MENMLKNYFNSYQNVIEKNRNILRISSNIDKRKFTKKSYLGHRPHPSPENETHKKV